MLLKNSKKAQGFLTARVIGVVLSIISISILLYLFFSLSGIFLVKTELEQARASVENLESELKYLEKGKSGSFIVESPNGWYISSFKNNDALDLCKNKGCLCFCQEDSIQSCRNGACKGFKKSVTTFFDTGKTFGENSLYLSNLPLELDLDLNNEGYKIILPKTKVGEAYFNEFLDYKIDDLSIESLIHNYLKSCDKECNAELRDKLDDLVNSFGESKNYLVHFRLVKSDSEDVLTITYNPGMFDKFKEEYNYQKTFNTGNNEYKMLMRIAT